MSLALVIVCGGGIYFSINFCWLSNFVAHNQSPYSYPFFCFLYTPLTDIIIIFVPVSLDHSVLLSHLSVQVWRDKTRSIINNGALGVNTNLPI